MLFHVRVFGWRGNRVFRYGAAAVAIVVAFFTASPCMADSSASEVRDMAEKAMRKALASSATWRMERKLPGTERTLASSGTVDCNVGGEGIEWRTLEPFRSLVAMKKDAMVFEDEDGRREKTLDEMPRYSDIRNATDAFANGQTAAFDDVFETVVEPLEHGRWKAVFIPRNAMLRSLVESLELEGSSLPETAVLKSGNGISSKITFAERRCDAK